MSSYNVELENHLLFVGWDRPLDTFFATLEIMDDVGMEEPEMLLGTAPGAYRDIAGFQAALKKALTERGILDFSLDNDLWQQLQQDYKDNPPGAGLQAKTKAMRDLQKSWFSDINEHNGYE